MPKIQGLVHLAVCLKNKSEAQFRYTNPKDRVKISMSTRKFPLVFKRSETLSSSAHTESVLPTQNQLCL